MPATTNTSDFASVSVLRHTVMRKRPIKSRIERPANPKPVTFSTMRHSKLGTRGAPMFSVLPVMPTMTAKVPLKMEISSLNWRLNPFRVGDISMRFITALRARLAVLEARQNIILEHRRTPKGTALVGSMAVKPAVEAVEVSEAELLRRQISAEIAASGGFIERMVRPAATDPKVVRRRRARGAAKAKVSWLDVVETKSVTA